MLVLLGKYARGDWVEDPSTGAFSELQLLVLVERAHTARDEKRWTELEARAAQLTMPVPLWLLVHTVDEVNEQLLRGSRFFGRIERESIVLHDASGIEWRGAAPIGGPERAALAQESFQRCLACAAEYYARFEIALREGRLVVAAFELRDSLEWLYRTVFVVFTDYEVREDSLLGTDALVRMDARCLELAPNLRDRSPRENVRVRRVFELLAWAEASGNELVTAALWVREFRERVEIGCREHLTALANGAVVE